MRRKDLFDHVATAIADYWINGNEDVTEAVLADEDAFGALAYTLNRVADGDPDDITTAFEDAAQSLTDEELDFMTGDPDDPNAPAADSPAAFLANRVKEVQA